MSVTCVVCGASQWRTIPNPVEGRSVTTSGVLLQKSLSRVHCAECGLMTRIDTELLGETDYYEKQYGGYYRRAGAVQYDSPRYLAMARWMHEVLQCADIRTILDVGCGAGWSMRATQQIFPNSSIEGIEPSVSNAELAREAGYTVHSGRIGAESRDDLGEYDLVYSNNVFQHVLSPVDFLSSVRDRLCKRGLLVLVFPDASRPGDEMLWCDHNYSFMPSHISRIAAKVGLYVVGWQTNPDVVSLHDKQLVVLSKMSGPHISVGRPGTREMSPDDLYIARHRYVKAWQSVHDYLAGRSTHFPRIVNFGASMWTWLLAGYCPDYWANVDSCTVDDFSGTCIDKEVVPFATMEPRANTGLVLGINPVTHARFAQRLDISQYSVIGWDHCLKH